MYQQISVTSKQVPERLIRAFGRLKLILRMP